jgi:hypothetical protein
MAYANFVANEVYDTLFKNNHVKLDFVKTFEDGFIDNAFNRIYMLGSEFGDFVITIEKLDGEENAKV